jgi:hypothetical protein
MCGNHDTVATVGAKAQASRCTRCGHAFSAAEWAAMRLLGRLGQGDLAAVVDPWPTHRVVEVRACAGCGGTLSRMRPAC